MVVVSHDRYFLERVSDHVIALIGGKLAYLPGGVEEYLDLRDRAEAAASRPAGRSAGGSAAARSAAGLAAAGSAASSPAGAPATSAARQRVTQKELGRLERQLERVSVQEAELTAALAENASDYAKLIELGAQLRAVQDQKAGLEDRWLALAEEGSG
jgi:ATP-binding cassette subfamily F protein uup